MERLEDLLAATARAMPDAVYLREKGGGRVSYADLDAAAGAVAEALRGMGIGPGDRIGLCLHKTAATVAALFGILKAGAAYVPVDRGAPVARGAGIFADCGVAAILTDEEASGPLMAELAGAHPVSRVADTGGLVCLRASREREKAPADTAYILYTSGSTGKPKGVVHTHASALAYVRWCEATFTPKQSDCFSSHAPFHFDLSILDLYVPIHAGASVRLIGADEGRQPGELVRMIERDRITNWYSTPTILRAMTDFGHPEDFDLGSLRVICFAGEVFPTPHLKALARALPRPRYYNLFGPTETNVCTAFALSDPRTMADDESVPIGGVASSNLLRIVDEGGADVPVGQAGELHVAGGSVMTGYWANPERNAAGFVEARGQRWYRTGDIVVERPDGILIYHGRRDRMIKRRGYRIELGEIEAALSRHPAIAEVAVVAVATPTGDSAIVAFYGNKGEAPLSLIALKRHSAEHLPLYMVPDRFEQVGSIPMTSTDKTDYQRLKGLADGLLAH